MKRVFVIEWHDLSYYSNLNHIEIGDEHLAVNLIEYLLEADGIVQVFVRMAHKEDNDRRN